MLLKKIKYSRSNKLPNGDTETISIEADLHTHDIADKCLQTLKKWVKDQFDQAGEDKKDD